MIYVLNRYKKNKSSSGFAKQKKKRHFLSFASLFIIEGTVNSSTYIDIIKENLPTTETLYPDVFLLQQDNTRTHTSRQTTKWLNDNGINILKWPASSPVLSLLENLWGIMKYKVENAGNRTVKEWKEDLVKIWDKTTFDTFKSFTESMPRRLQTVIDAKRETINYTTFSVML